MVLEARGRGPISINVRITAVRKLAIEAADNGLLAAASGYWHRFGFPEMALADAGGARQPEKEAGLRAAGRNP